MGRIGNKQILKKQKQTAGALATDNRRSQREGGFGKWVNIDRSGSPTARWQQRVTKQSILVPAERKLHFTGAIAFTGRTGGMVNAIAVTISGSGALSQSIFIDKIGIQVSASTPANGPTNNVYFYTSSLERTLAASGDMKGPFPGGYMSGNATKRLCFPARAGTIQYSASEGIHTANTSSQVNAIHYGNVHTGTYNVIVEFNAKPATAKGRIHLFTYEDKFYAPFTA